MIPKHTRGCQRNLQRLLYGHDSEQTPVVLEPHSHPRPEPSLCLCSQDLPEPQLDAESKAAFDTAFDNIRAFHAAQQSPPLTVETMPGVKCQRVTRPIGERR